MDLGISGKTAFVAASTGGLGLAVARGLAAEGARVAITGRRGELAEKIAAELQADGHSAVAVEADLSTLDGVTAAVERAVELLGPIDILVLNGPGPKPGAAASLGSDDIAAAFELLGEAAPRPCLAHPAGDAGAALGTDPGRSDQAEWWRPCPTSPSPTRAAQPWPGYLKTLAAEVALDAVTVNMLLPGRIATDRVAELDRAAAKRRGTTPEEIQLESRKTIPARRYGEPEEFGAAGAFLCSAPASYITGVALRCDGGLIRSL